MHNSSRAVVEGPAGVQLLIRQLAAAAVSKSQISEQLVTGGSVVYTLPAARCGQEGSKHSDLEVV